MSASAEEFNGVARMLAQSAIGRTIARARTVIRASASRSATMAALGFAMSRWRSSPATDRSRLAGLVMVVALVTQKALMRFVPAELRPATSAWLWMDALMAGCVLISAAPHLARAWPGSRVRRIIRAFLKVGGVSL